MDLQSLRQAAFFGAILVLPLAALEAVNVGLTADFPVALFGFLWLLAVAILLVLMPILRKVRGGTFGPAEGPAMAIRGLALVALAWVFVQIVADQMPCFLGVPNCD